MLMVQSVYCVLAISGYECMGWSDLTELQIRQHILNLVIFIKVKDNHVQLKGASLAWMCWVCDIFT